MPGPLSRRARAVLAVAAAVLVPARAAAQPSPCGPAATVRVDIEPGIDPPGTRRVVEQILAEVSASAESDCEARSKTQIEVHWVSNDRVRLTVTVQHRNATERAERDLDVAAVSADGRSLAIAIAADELLTEARARLRLAEATPEAPAPVASAPKRAPRAARRAGIARAFGPALAIDVLGKDVLLGPDARAAFWLTPHVSLTARLGLRVAATTSPSDPWAAIIGGARVQLSPIAWDIRRGVAFTVGADVLALRPRETPALTARALPSAGLAGWLRVGPRIVLTGDLGAGAVLGGGQRSFALTGGVGFAVPF
ncbi:Hypothetical protein A7982_03705 [Minicystis rosea]|nr:Hypothetical protein A7982_03705 [Minicystis rosea]